MMGWFRPAALAALLAVGLALPALAADDKEAQRRFGDDLYAAGSDLRIAEPGLEDVFAAGRSVVLSAAVRESVHAAGRRVRIGQAVGRDLYAAGADVEVAAPVAGDVTALGEQVEIGEGGSAGQDIVLAGRSLVVAGPVGGDASLAGEEVLIAAPITGSVQIRAERIRFGPGARIDGTLAYWSSNPVVVPPGVIPPERVRGVLVKREPRRSTGDRAGEFVTHLLFLLLAAGVLGAIFPDALGRAHERLVARPWLNLLLGVVATSALFGSVLVLAASIIGLPLVPVMILAWPFALLAGYLAAAYSLGRLALGIARVRPIPGRLGAFAAMAAGIVLLAIVGLIPIFGWVVCVLTVVMGMGAWFMLLLRPREVAP